MSHSLGNYWKMLTCSAHPRSGRKPDGGSDCPIILPWRSLRGTECTDHLLWFYINPHNSKHSESSRVSADDLGPHLSKKVPGRHLGIVLGSQSQGASLCHTASMFVYNWGNKTSSCWGMSTRVSRHIKSPPPLAWVENKAASALCCTAVPATGTPEVVGTRVKTDKGPTKVCLCVLTIGAHFQIVPPLAFWTSPPAGATCCPAPAFPEEPLRAPQRRWCVSTPLSPVCLLSSGFTWKVCVYLEAVAIPSTLLFFFKNRFWCQWFMYTLTNKQTNKQNLFCFFTWSHHVCTGLTNADLGAWHTLSDLGTGVIHQYQIEITSTNCKASYWASLRCLSVQSILVFWGKMNVHCIRASSANTQHTFLERILDIQWVARKWEISS
jgi:hypothetical protein